MAARLGQNPPLHELLDYADVGDRWKEVGIRLKLDHKALKNIDADCQNVTYKLIGMYELWLDSNPNATRREIIDVLKKVGEASMAKKYELNCTGMC